MVGNTILTKGQISVGSTAAYCKLGNGTVRNLCQDTIYTHPSSQQCGPINVNNATGILSVSNGGTGQTTISGLISTIVQSGGFVSSVSGSYTGNGSSVSLAASFVPRLVIVTCSECEKGWASSYTNRYQIGIFAKDIGISFYDEYYSPDTGTSQHRLYITVIDTTVSENTISWQSKTQTDSKKVTYKIHNGEATGENGTDYILGMYRNGATYNYTIFG